jgi:hypothetical protein
MAGHKEQILAFAVTIQPTPGTFNPPGVNDLIPISSPDNGFDPIVADDDTLTGSLWTAARQFLGTRGRAGATCRLRGPGGAAPPALGAWPLGRILQGAGFTETRNAAAITNAVQANAAVDKIVLDAGASSVDDFYKGWPIAHAGLGAGMRAYSMVRSYVGASKIAELSENALAAINAGNYTIPAGLFYTLSTGSAIPLLSVSVWRHRKRYDYKDCALSSFAADVPVSNDAQTTSPTVQFAMMGVPIFPVADDLSPSLPSSILTPTPPAKAGKFGLAKTLIGHQSLKIDFGLTTGAPPNQNFDLGQENYEVLDGKRTVTLDVNQMLTATLDLEALANNQTLTPVESIWGLGLGNRFAIGLPNLLLNPLSPNARNGFVGMQGDAAVNDIDRSVNLALIYA